MDTTSLDTVQKTLVNRGFTFIESLPTSDRFLLKGTLALFLLSLLWLATALNAATLVAVPDHGGTLTEGIVGTPRFINPILAVTGADQDLVALVYAGIMKLGQDGELIPDIAESVSVSDDGLTYTVLLRENVSFHDGAPFSVDDIIFTVLRIQDPLTKSPLRASWEGIAMERIDDRQMQFVLTEPYAPFLENLTLGILPKHIWEHAAPEELPFSQYNSEPVGAGPYQVSEIVRNNSGIPQSYELTPHTGYFADTPKITKLVLTFYPTEQDLVAALINHKVESAGGLTRGAIDALKDADARFSLTTTPLPRTFILFFNQNKAPLFRDSTVRTALARVVDRQILVDEALGGYGMPVASPIPPGFAVDRAQTENANGITAIDDARQILREGGWRFREESGLWEKKSGDDILTLSFSISTANTPVFEQTARILKTQWEALGVPVTVRQFEQSDLIQSVIRPREYEALLFGTAVGRELDFFSFWHSSQRNDPGLNVALYANITTDALLAEARATHSADERAVLYQKFSAEMTKETPAIFLYVPTYTYVTPPDIQNVRLDGIARGSERFSHITDWYSETDAVWPFFTK